MFIISDVYNNLPSSTEDQVENDQDFDSGTEVSSITESHKNEDQAEKDKSGQETDEEEEVEEGKEEHFNPFENQSEAITKSRTSSFIQTISTQQLEGWIDQSRQWTRNQDKEKEEYKSFMEELRKEEKQREEEGKKVQDWVEIYIAERERRHIEEELEKGSSLNQSEET